MVVGRSTDERGHDGRGMPAMVLRLPVDRGKPHHALDRADQFHFDGSGCPGDRVGKPPGSHRAPWNCRRITLGNLCRLRYLVVRLEHRQGDRC